MGVRQGRGVPLTPARLGGSARSLTWVLPALGGLAVVAVGALSTAGARAVLGRATPVLVFLVAVTALAGILDAAGVFEVAAARAARAGPGRTCCAASWWSR